MSSQNYPISSLEQAIFATIAYYDYFNYPLTAVEIYKYLIKPNTKYEIPNTKTTDSKIKPAFNEIIDILDGSEWLKKLIGQKNGFYFLRGRREIIEQRIQRKKLTDQKLKKSNWILRFVYCLPFVRLVMISGTVAIGNPSKKSDIDLLVVAKAGRIWTTRAFLTFFALIFGKYRHTGETENKLCLNHYITDKTLAIDFGNLYKAQEYLNILPAAGEPGIYDGFFAANRKWMEKYLCCAGGSNRSSLRNFSPGRTSAGCKYILEYFLGGKIGDMLECYAKNFQIKHIKKNPLTSGEHARVRYDDGNLVFHPVLVEPKIIGKYEEKIKLAASS